MRCRAARAPSRLARRRRTSNGREWRASALADVIHRAAFCRESTTVEFRGTAWPIISEACLARRRSLSPLGCATRRASSNPSPTSVSHLLLRQTDERSRSRGRRPLCYGSAAVEITIHALWTRVAAKLMTKDHRGDHLPTGFVGACLSPSGPRARVSALQLGMQSSEAVLRVVREALGASRVGVARDPSRGISRS